MSLLTKHVKDAVHAGSESALSALSVIKDTVAAVNMSAIKDRMSTVDIKTIKDTVSAVDMTAITAIVAQNAVNTAGQVSRQVDDRVTKPGTS